MYFFNVLALNSINISGCHYLSKVKEWPQVSIHVINYENGKSFHLC